MVSINGPPAAVSAESGAGSGVARGGGQVVLQVAPSVGRFSAAILPPSLLKREYEEMLAEDPDVKLEALRAAYEMRRTPIDELDQKTVTMPLGRNADEGKVGRRAPPNPFHSPLLNRGKTGRSDKVSDPALRSNPLRGRLMVTVGVNAALFMVFVQSLVSNRLTTGSFYASRSENSNIGAGAATLYELGGLNANAVRSGEWIRMFWSMWMHSGWLHIGLNILCQLQYFYMLEPDWGVCRTLLIFWFAGISGNLLSMIMDPCKTTVGSSGGLFGLMGGVVPYCIEYWHSIPRPMCILIFSIFTVIITLATGLTKSTDTWAHLGGLLGGLLFGFGTITTPAAFLRNLFLCPFS
ncbi:S54 family peptidase [Gregarina niphandrodes]|uniref:Rhomboid-like protease n=1 Tax=Gregarina niphandrodes TaxID=110365 RepID=A0A023B066_GRENI|nr:S54 family peptidase [Gregarina niphandrodes]EZG44368.1 S54 family peptidase [Gregarina niphandrodes]|eukprot:XP_011132683.1 S54 family peptidase [Gregarina niphandrodes]